MLVLKRKEGQWVEVTHRSGDILRIRVCKIEGGSPGHLNLAFDDDPRATSGSNALSVGTNPPARLPPRPL